jgi:hypothetical protein
MQVVTFEALTSQVNQLCNESTASSDVCHIKTAQSSHRIQPVSTFACSEQMRLQPRFTAHLGMSTSFHGINSSFFSGRN